METGSIQDAFNLAQTRTQDNGEPVGARTRRGSSRFDRVSAPRLVRIESFERSRPFRRRTRLSPPSDDGRSTRPPASCDERGSFYGMSERGLRMWYEVANGGRSCPRDEARYTSTPRRGGRGVDESVRSTRRRVSGRLVGGRTRCSPWVVQRNFVCPPSRLGVRGRPPVLTLGSASTSSVASEGLPSK